MGYIKHDAIIVTTSDRERILKIRRMAKKVGLAVSSIVQSPVNDYHSFLVASDGSKERWHESDVGDNRRQLFKEWLDKNHPELYPEWVHVSYGSDQGTGVIEGHSD